MQAIDLNKWKDLLIALALLLLGFLFRWLYVVNLQIDMPSQVDISLPFQGDETSYYYYAKNLWEYGVFSRDTTASPVPDSYWAPGYPLFLVLCFKLASMLHLGFYPIVLSVQAVLGGITTGVTYLLGRSFLSITAACFGAALVILSPHLNSHGGYLLSETLFAFLILISLYFFLHAVKSNSLIYWVVSGCAFGLSYLTNPVILFLPLLLIAVYVFSRYGNGRKEAIKSAVLFLILFLLFVAGWEIRSYINVPQTSASSGQRAFENLVLGADKRYHNTWYANTSVADPALRVVSQADADMKMYKDDHQAFYHELIRRVGADPEGYLQWYFVQKPLDLWGWKILVGDGDIYVFRVSSSIYHNSGLALASLVIMKQLHFWLFGLAVLGVIFALRDSNALAREALLPLYALLIYTSAVFVVLHADARYSVPMRPEMYLCAVYAAGRLFKCIKTLNERQQSTSLTG